MPKRFSVQGRPVLLLVLLGVIWWFVPVIFKSIGKLTFYEFQAPSWVAASTMRDLQNYWAMRMHSKDELIEAGRDLARLNAAYELNRLENDKLRDEIARLESILNLPSHDGYRYEVARVVRRDINSWWQQLVIRKGADAKIPVGAAVVYSGGVVGVVKEVHAYTSVVELVSSRSFRMAARFEEDTRPVTYQGKNNPMLTEPEGIVADVQMDVQATDNERGLRLVSSELGGVFPDGLTIGYVKALEPSPNGLFQTGTVQLNKNLLGLAEVAIIVPVLPEDAPR